MISVYVKNFEGVCFGVAYDGEDVFGTSFASSEERALKDMLANLPFNASFQQVDKPSTFGERMMDILKDVYEGKDVSSKLSFATKHLPKYTRRVLETTYLIPLGYATSYGAIAKAVGGGPRAVGNVMARNPFAPIVPCHRVVRSDLTLGGYGGGFGSGLATKLQFLKRERRGFTRKREIPVEGRRLVVFPVEFVLKEVEKRGKLG
jgi:O-6-methylguanine DNA methyltransferase